MRRLLFLASIIAFAGCKLPTQPEEPRFDNPREAYVDFFLYHSPIPAANYDAVFTASLRNANFLGSDSTRQYYDESASFFNALGDIIRQPMDSVRLTLNGVQFQYWGWIQDKPVPLNFPQPVSWQLFGDDYFVSFQHQLASEQPIAILAPNANDTLDAMKPFNLSYSAPEADSVTILTFYSGIADVKSGDSVRVDSFAFTDSKYLRPNTGTFTVPAYSMGSDSLFFQAFHPQSVMIAVAWAKGDSIHVGPRLYGFVNERVRSVEYYIKP